jgi:hypothetical protein
MPTSSEILALDYENTFYPKVFLWWQKPFFADDLGDDRYKKNSLLVFDMCGQYCFPENSIVLSRARCCSLPKHTPHYY